MSDPSLFDAGDTPRGGKSAALEPFEFPFTGQQVRALIIDDEPWFVAVDACTILQLGNHRSSVALLDDDERAVHAVDTPGGPQQMLIINESGLYSLVLRSRKAEAKAFKRWITRDVLPSIRKTGAYGVASREFDPQNLDHVAQLARIAADQRRAIEARDEKIAELEPKAEQADHHRAADGLMTVGDFANKLKAWAKDNHGVKVLHQEVWDYCRELGLLMKSTNTIRKNRVTSFATENGYMREKDSEWEDKQGNTHTSHTPRLTAKGEGYVWDRATERIKATGTLRKAIGGAA